MSLITRVHRSTLLLLSFLVSFGIFCVTGALPYGESESADTGGDISLTGTITSGGDLGTIWLGATGSTSGLKFNANTNTFTGSMYSSQIGIIYINSGSSNGMKINGDLKATSSSLDLVGNIASPISFYSPAVGIITGGVGAKVDGSTKKISSVYPLTLSNSPGLGSNILTISGVTLLPTPHHIINGDLGTGVYIASSSINIQVDSAADAPYSIKLTDINDASRTYSTGSISDSITVNDSLVKTSGEYSYELTDKNGNISKGKIRIVAAKLDNTISSITNDTTYPTNIKIANNSKQYSVTFYPKDEFGNHITGNEYLNLKAARTLIGGYKLNSIEAPYSPTSTEPLSWSPHTLASSENSLSGSTAVSNQIISASAGVWFGFASKSPNGSTQIRLDLETQKTDGTSLSNLSQTSNTYTFKPLIAISNLTLSPSVSVRQAESVMRPIYTQTGGVTDAKIAYIITSSGSSDEMEIRQVESPDCSDLNLNQGSTPTCGWINASGGTTLSSTLQYDLSTQSGSHEVGVTFSGGTSTNTGYLTAIAEYTIGGENIVTLIKEGSFTIDDTAPAGPKVIIIGQYGSSQLGQSLTGGVDLLSSDLFIRERDKIRKQAKVMRSYIQTPSGTAKIQAGTMTNSGILIVEGNIEIDSDIWDWNTTSSAPNPPPKIIIALKKSDGTGGNIYIKNNVKNIAASLIADGSIFGDTTVGSNQLYIYGTIISNNTIGGANTAVCPRFLNLDSCTAGNYDLENLRDNTTGIGASNTPNSTPSIIIQADPRLSGSSPLLILQGR